MPFVTNITEISPKGRYLIDGDNLVAGLGHLTASFNVGLKIAKRNDLKIITGDLESPNVMLRHVAKRVQKLLVTIPSSMMDHQSTLLDQYRSFLDIPYSISAKILTWVYINIGLLKLIDLPDVHRASNWIEDDKKYNEIDEIIRNISEGGVVFKLPGNRLSNCDGDFGSSAGILQKLYLRSRCRRRPKIHFKQDSISIAFNIRRGDIVRLERFRNRLLPDEYFCNILKSIFSIFSPEKTDIWIFSDADSNGNYINEYGKPIDWSRHPYLIDTPVHQINTHLDEREWLSAIDHMIDADLLITSNSGFSHLATVLRSGPTLAPVGWKGYKSCSNVFHLNATEQVPTLDEIISVLKKIDLRATC